MGPLTMLMMRKDTSSAHLVTIAALFTHTSPLDLPTRRLESSSQVPSPCLGWSRPTTTPSPPTS